MNELDITELNLKGKALHDEITHLVKDTQRILVRPYPSILKMTKKQYNSLAGKPEMMSANIDNQDYYLYRTIYNVMEVEIE